MATKPVPAGCHTATIEDPFGHVWTIATHVEDLSHEEIMRRAETATNAAAKGKSS